MIPGTRTQAKLEVSDQAFEEIRAKLAAADYCDAYETTLSMDGIALVRERKSNGSQAR